MHAKPEWLPQGYRNWDALLTAAVRRACRRQRARRCGRLDVMAIGMWWSWSIRWRDSCRTLAAWPMSGPLPLSGDTTTVKQVARANGPSQRFTMDWSNVDGSTENIVLGESGNPLSPYFRDQWNDWYNGTTFALPFTPAAVAAQTSHTLRLLP